MVIQHDFKKFPELTDKQIQEFGAFSPHKQYVEDFDALCVKVTDGDTIIIRTTERDFDFPLRLLEVDSKELGEGGEEAKRWLQEKIEGQNIRVVMNPFNRVGKYGRLLGHVLYGGLYISEEMAALGLAFPFGSKNEGKILPIGFTLNQNKWFQ